MATAEVLLAKDYASDLLRWETRGPGDTDNAMRRISNRHGIEYGSLWSLRYRAPKRIWADVLTSLREAHARECARQRRMLDHAATAAELLLGADRPSVRKARAVARRPAGEAASLVDEVGQ